MSSQIDLIYLFLLSLIILYHNAASYKIFILVFPYLPGTYKQAISFSSWQLYNPLFWVAL